MRARASCTAAIAVSPCSATRRQPSCSDCSRRPRRRGDPRLLSAFSVPVPENLPLAELRALLESQGYVRFLDAPRDATVLTVIQDRLRLGNAEPAACRRGAGSGAARGPRSRAPFTRSMTMARRRRPGASRAACTAPTATSPTRIRRPATSRSTRRWVPARPAAVSVASSGVDYDLVIPDAGKTLRGGAIKPWQTATGKECQDDMEKHARAAGVPLDKPWQRSVRRRSAQWVLRRRRPQGPQALVRRRRATSSISSARPTRCTCACCCRDTAATRRARPATARG